VVPFIASPVISTFMPRPSAAIAGAAGAGFAAHLQIAGVDHAGA